MTRIKQTLKVILHTLLHQKLIGGTVFFSQHLEVHLSIQVVPNQEEAGTEQEILR